MTVTRRLWSLPLLVCPSPMLVIIGLFPEQNRYSGAMSRVRVRFRGMSVTEASWYKMLCR